MNIADVITIGREALIITMMIAAPLLGGTLLVGVIIGILQAATSIQEMTLSFIPKLIVLVATLSVWWLADTHADRVFPGLLANLPTYLQ